MRRDKEGKQLADAVDCEVKECVKEDENKDLVSRPAFNICARFVPEEEDKDKARSKDAKVDKKPCNP